MQNSNRLTDGEQMTASEGVEGLSKKEKGLMDYSGVIVEGRGV